MYHTKFVNIVVKIFLCSDINFINTQKIRQLEKDYQILASDFQTMQNEYQQVVQLNNEYAQVIAKLNGSFARRDASNQPGLRETKGDEKDLPNLVIASQDECKKEIKEIQSNNATIVQKLNDKETELKALNEKTKRLYKSVGIEENATDALVIQKLEQLTKTEVEMTAKQKDLFKLASDKMRLEAEVNQLMREKERNAFKLNQKIALEKVSENVKKINMEQIVTKLKEIEMSYNNGTVNTIADSSLPQTSAKEFRKFLYCIFCRTDYQPTRGTLWCRIHYGPFRDGKFTCCGDPLHRGDGCLRINHHFINKDKDNAYYITDAVNPTHRFKLSVPSWKLHNSKKCYSTIIVYCTTIFIGS